LAESKDDSILASKIIPPLDKLIKYIDTLPLVIEPFSKVSLNLLIESLQGSKINIRSMYFDNSLAVYVHSDAIYELARNDMIYRIRFDGDHMLFRGNFKEEGKIDKYLAEFLFLLKATPVIVQAVDGLKDEDRKRVEELGGKVKDDLRIINSYSATLPLGKVEELARFPRVIRIWYDQPLYGM
jgi:hypothetical protein